MRILTIHSDFIEFQPLTKAIKNPEPIELAKKRIEECLVVFTSIEEGDTVEVVENTKKEIVNIANQVDAHRIVIYPFVHLSSKPAKPEIALSLLKELEKIEGLEVIRAPFGWYKSFNIKCKGHPLSELSREIKPSERPAPGVINKRRPAGEEAKDRYLVLLPDGTEYSPSEYCSKFPESPFKLLVEKEGLKIGLKGENKEPEYFKICKKYGIDWEPMSDVGHLRFAPNGALLFDLVSDYSRKVLDFGIPVLQVKGSNLFNLRERAVKEHADLFGDRLYSVEVEDDEFVMRYAACHAQFAMVRDWVITYKQLPFGVFEIADSYRLEQRGETLLCFRMRRFFMPDFHVFCRDVEEAKNWFSTIHEKIYSEIEKAGGDYEMLFNFSSEDEYIKSREWILSLLRRKGKPALLHFYPPGKKYYWTVNVEYCIIDEQKRPMEIATVQIDVGNAERFGISYIDKDGERKRPVIIHTAVIGSIERYLYAIFDFAIKARKRTGLIQIPLWLNPEQVRIVPIGESHLKRAIEIAELMERRNIRVGIDDRNETINKKIREAKMDWVNYVIVIGDKEVKSDKVPVYVREKNANIEMNIESLIKEIEEKTNGMPFRPMYIPREMSKRPIY